MARRSLIDTLLVPRIAALLDELPAALAGDRGAVHRSRVASRRLREVLPPMRDVLPRHAAERARLAVRRVTRALGSVRELDVAIGLFDELAEAHGLAAAARQVVRRTMVRERDATLGRLRTALPARRGERLKATLAVLVAQTGPDLAAVARLTSAVDRRVARRGGRVRKALDRAGSLYVPERLHKVRIAVKQLRYALEVAGDARRSRTTARVAQLRAIQDLLGRAHDLHVLGERVRRVQTRVIRTSRSTAAELGRLAAVIDEACRTEHAAFMSRRAGLVTLCDALDAPPAQSRRQSVA
jgi:CHAD domain-containing protein